MLNTGYTDLIGGALRPRHDPAWPALAPEVPVGALPSSAFVTLGLPQHQAHAGSCLAHGFTAALEGDARARTGAVVQLNRLDLYFGARWLAGDETRDVGSYPDKAAEWLLRYGTVSEALKPYDPSVVTTWRPPASWAAERRLLTADLQPMPRSLDAIKAELAADRGVVVCHHVYQQMVNEAGATGVEIEPAPNAARSLGGHCRKIIGYDDARGAALLLNWWRGWGRPHPGSTTERWYSKFTDGCSWVPYETLMHPEWAWDYRRIARGLSVEV